MRHIIVAVLFATAVPLAQAAEDPADVAAVVAAVKQANPDFRALCQKGREGITRAVTEAAVSLAGAGTLKGSPQAVGAEAGQQIGRECRGG